MLLYNAVLPVWIFFYRKKNDCKRPLFSFSKIYWWFVTWQKKEKRHISPMLNWMLDVGKWSWSVKSKQCKYWLCLWWWALLLNLSAKTSHAKGASLSASRLVSYILLIFQYGKTYCLTGFYLSQTVFMFCFVFFKFQIQSFQAAPRKVSHH